MAVEPDAAQAQTAIEQKVQGSRGLPTSLYRHAVGDIEPVSLDRKFCIQIVMVDSKIPGPRQ